MNRPIETHQLPTATGPSGAPLSPRELEVLALLAAGRSNAEVAEVLAISLNTVQRHVSTIYAKFEARDHAGSADDSGVLGLAEAGGQPAAFEQRIRRRRTHAIRRDM